MDKENGIGSVVEEIQRVDPVVGSDSDKIELVDLVVEPSLSSTIVSNIQTNLENVSLASTPITPKVEKQKTATSVHTIWLILCFLWSVCKMCYSLVIGFVGILWFVCKTMHAHRILSVLFLVLAILGLLVSGDKTTANVIMYCGQCLVDTHDNILSVPEYVQGVTDWPAEFNRIVTVYVINRWNGFGFPQWMYWTPWYVVKDVLKVRPAEAWYMLYTTGIAIGGLAVLAVGVTGIGVCWACPAAGMFVYNSLPTHLCVLLYEWKMF